MNLDYTSEINAFYDWLETNTLSDSAIVLWHALMHTCNRAGWPSEFAVAVSTLANKTGLKKDAINRARHRLQQTGRIDFQSRTGQQSAIYKIIPLCGATNAAKCNASQAQSASQGTPQRSSQSASIINDLDNLSSSSSYQGGMKEYESFYAAHERVFGFGCNPLQSQNLSSYLDDGMDEAVVIRAIERAGKSSTGYNFKFISRIVDDYFKSGALTLAQAEALDTEYEARKNRKPMAYSNSNSEGRKTKQQQELQDLKRRAEEARREQVGSV